MAVQGPRPQLRSTVSEAQRTLKLYGVCAFCSNLCESPGGDMTHMLDKSPAVGGPMIEKSKAKGLLDQSFDPKKAYNGLFLCKNCHCQLHTRMIGYLVLPTPILKHLIAVITENKKQRSRPGTAADAPPPRAFSLSATLANLPPHLAAISTYYQYIAMAPTDPRSGYRALLPYLPPLSVFIDAQNHFELTPHRDVDKYREGELLRSMGARSEAPTPLYRIVDASSALARMNDETEVAGRALPTIAKCPLERGVTFLWHLPGVSMGAMLSMVFHRRSGMAEQPTFDEQFDDWAALSELLLALDTEDLTTKMEQRRRSTTSPTKPFPLNVPPVQNSSSPAQGQP